MVIIWELSYLYIKGERDREKKEQKKSQKGLSSTIAKPQTKSIHSQIQLQKIRKKMDSLWIFVQVITAAAFISSTIIILKNFIIPTTPSSSSSNSFTSSNNPSLPSGSLGLPFVGETLHFVSSAYSHRPDTFMDTRRRRWVPWLEIKIFIQLSTQ